MVVYDIVLNGEVKETIKPLDQRLKNMYYHTKEQIKLMKAKYGKNIVVNRRILY
jgi:hypothetical protein